MLELTLLGTGSPIHTGHRFGPSQVVADGDTRILVDTGWSSTLRLVQAGMPPQSITAVFFTHLHSDHTTDLADFMVMRWVSGIREPLRIYGPEGTKRMVGGFQQAMEADTRYRIAHHGDKLWDQGLACDITELPDSGPDRIGEDPQVIATIGPITVSAFEVDHRPVKPAYGFRFESSGRSIAISGDTNPCEGLVNGARDADILVCDSMNVTMLQAIERGLEQAGNAVQADLLHDAENYHADVKEMAALAQRAGVKHLVMSHVIPPVPENQTAVFTAGLDAVFKGKLTVGKDLERFPLG
jgi:ribonuclease Z